MSIFLKYKISFLVFFLAVSIAYASESSGTIDASYKLTKICKNTTCSEYGNVNWKPTLNAQTSGAVAVSITDTSISGHIWGDEIGWINLAPTGQGLTVNPNTGVVSGKAYSQSGSWIVFNVTGQSVTLVDNGSGSNFYGYAWVSGPNGGWMKFDCSDPSTCIKTDWRRVGNRTTTPPPSTGGGGGGTTGGTPPSAPAPITPPTPPAAPPPIPVVPPAPAPVNVPLPATPPATNMQTQSGTASSGQGGFSGSVSSNTYVDAPLSLTNMVSEKIYFRFSDDKIGFPPKKGSFIYGDRNNEQIFEGEFFRVPVGKKIGLALKAKNKPLSIKTYVLYKGSINETRREINPKWTLWDRILDLFGMKRRKLSLLNSLINSFASVAYAQGAGVGNDFTRSKEDYTGYPSVDYVKDDKGIYRSEVEVSDEAGLYEFRTVVDYGNGEKYETKSTSVVFDQGESVSFREKYLFGLENNVSANVTVYVWNNKNNVFDLWNGEFYGQNNPVKTDDQGRYSIVVPPGAYKFFVEASGYHSYYTDVIEIGEDNRIINYRVSLACSFWSNYKCLPYVKVAMIGVLGYLYWRYRLRKIQIDKV